MSPARGRAGQRRGRGDGAVREIPRESRSNAFLIKALREAAGELLGELEALRPREAGWGPDGEWSFLQIAAHLSLNEEIAAHNLALITRRREPRLTPEPFGITAEDAGPRRLDLDEAAYGYAGMRERVVGSLYRLDDDEWQRTGVHPYRGPLSVLQIARELHLHDIEHLLQVRAHRQAMAGLVR